METRKRVERAKGLLMEKMQLNEPEAFRWIQKTRWTVDSRCARSPRPSSTKWTSNSRRASFLVSIPIFRWDP